MSDNEYAVWKSRKMIDTAKLIVEAEAWIEKLLDDGTPTFMLESGPPFAFFNIRSFLASDNAEAFDLLLKQFAAVLNERGYRDEISTWQEHKLLGSTTWKGYMSQPHKPIGVIHSETHADGVKLTVSEAGVARELAVITAVIAEYYGLDTDERFLVKVAYEGLDSFGNTLRDPRPLDANNLGDALKKFPLELAIRECLIEGAVKSDDYPLRRD